MTIWIVRKHPPHPYNPHNHLRAFEIFSTHATHAEAKATADMKNSKKPYYLYTVRRVTLQEKNQ